MHWLGEGWGCSCCAPQPEQLLRLVLTCPPTLLGRGIWFPPSTFCAAQVELLGCMQHMKQAHGGSGFLLQIWLLNLLQRPGGVQDLQ